MEEIETRVAIIGVIVEDPVAVTPVNEVLHSYSSFIIGRMGLPYPKRGINIISIAIDAPQPVISAVSGALGHIDGVSVKTAYSRI